MRSFLAVFVLVVVGTVTSSQLKPVAPAKAADDAAVVVAAQIAKIDPLNQSEFPIDEVKAAQLVLIATVPDPKLTRLALFFDRWVESLQRAAEASRYVFKKQWIPWTRQQTEYADPGVLIFGNNGQTLAILLVGESPVAGISQLQFKAALKFAGGDRLAGVVGPCFSGGFESLRTLLAGRTDLMLSGAGDARKPKIVTGSATNADQLTSFAREFRLATAVDSDQRAAAAFEKYRNERPVAFGKIGVLAEGDTKYGGSKDSNNYAVTFPRDISVLRAAYEADQRLRKSIVQSADTLSASASVSLSRSEDLNTGRDSVPTQSPVATAATQDLAMQAVARRLSEDHVNLVSILATNALDILFLRQYMESHVSDMQFYLLEPDALFTHQPEVNAFHGTLSVSRYPLFIRPDRRIVAFPSKGAEGVYWAARSLLGGGLDGQSRHIWLSMIGIGGYWPVARILTDGEGAEGVRDCQVIGCDTAAPALEAMWEIHATKTYLGVWLLAVAALWAAVAAALAARRARLDGEAARKWCADFYFDPAAPLAFARRYHAYCLILGLLGLVMVLSRPLSPAVGRSIYLASLPGFIGLWCAWPLPARRATGTGDLWFDDATTAKDRSITVFLAALVTLGVAAFLIAVYLVVWRSHGEWPLFASYRSMYLGNGVNPTLPLLLASLAILSCAWYHFQRFIFTSERFVPLELSGFGTIGGPYERVRDILSCYATAPGIIAGIATAALVTGVALNYGSALTIEGRLYDEFVVALLSVCAGLTMLSVCQFLQTWWNLSDFLRGIEGLPIRRLFDKLPRDLGSVAIFGGGCRERPYLYMIKSRACLHQMPWMPQWIRDNVDASVDALLIRAGADERGTGVEIVAAQQSLLMANSYLLYYLQHEVWWKGESELQPPQDRDPHAALAEEFVAFRILAFIRYAVLQLRNLLTFFSVGFILMAMAVSCYPFFAQSLAQMFIGVAFTVLSGASGYVLLGMSRDRTLRRLSTDSNGQDRPVLFQALQSASLPLLAFASTYFPGLGRMLFSWLQPALSAIK